MDDDELAEAGISAVQPTAEYDTFGSTAAERARRQAQAEASARANGQLSFLPDDIIAPVADSMGEAPTLALPDLRSLLPVNVPGLFPRHGTLHSPQLMSVDAHLGPQPSAFSTIATYRLPLSLAILCEAVQVTLNPGVCTLRARWSCLAHEHCTCGGLTLWASSQGYACCRRWAGGRARAWAPAGQRPAAAAAAAAAAGAGGPRLALGQRTRPSMPCRPRPTPMALALTPSRCALCADDLM